MDRTDYQILNILQADSRCTLRHIGDQVGLTPPAVSERIRRMEECGVIRSYRIDIDRTRLDCNITGFISVSLEPEKYAAFCVFCEQSPAVISHHHVIGVFNALLQFAVRDTKELDALLAEIADLRRSGASDVQTDFSHDLLSVNDYYQTPGWLLRDLEGDGTSELLLGADWGDGCGVIFNIYRLDGAKAVRVVDGWSRSQYFLCSDGTLAHEWSGGADHWGRTYLRYGEALLPIESVFDRGGVWYHAKGLDALSLEDTQLEDRCKTISRAEAEQLMERYTNQYEALPFTPFAA